MIGQEKPTPKYCTAMFAGGAWGSMVVKALHY